MARKQGRQSFATMQDVARAAGVSAMTVSRMLRNPASISQDHAMRIREAMAQLAYVPNMLAGGLSGTVGRVVAVLVPTISHSVFAETLQGITDCLHREGYQMLVGSSNYNPETERELLRSLLAWRPAGVVVVSVDEDRSARETMSELGVPVVEIWDIEGSAIDMKVGYSNFDAAYAMTRHLVTCGCSQVAFIRTSRTNDIRTQEREQGYKAALRDLSEQPQRALRLDYEFSPSGGAEVMRWIKRHHPDVDAVFFATDVAAIGALYECRRLDIAVPEALRIAGFGDFSEAEVCVPRLTTVRVPQYEMGVTAATNILARLKGDTDVPDRIDVGFELIVRESA